MNGGQTFGELAPVAFFIVLGLGVLTLFTVLLYRYFPNEMAALFAKWAAPSEDYCKRKSAEMLAQMDKNVAERKANKLRNE